MAPQCAVCQNLGYKFVEETLVRTLPNQNGLALRSAYGLMLLQE
jgi:hypothetical protein